MKLSELHNGESAVIVKVSGHGGFRKRIMEMGFVRGRKVTSVIDAPLNDPIKYTIMGYDVLLRRSEAQLIEVLPEEEANAVLTAEDAETTTKPFFDTNLKLSYSFKLKDDVSLEVSAGMKNIFNSYQRDFDQGELRDAGYIYGPSLPRSIYFGIKISL